MQRAASNMQHIIQPLTCENDRGTTVRYIPFIGTLILLSPNHPLLAAGGGDARRRTPFVVILRRRGAQRGMF